MPPRTRTRATKLQKENIAVVKKYKDKSIENGTKTTRKALADKTNSLSDTDATNSSIKPQSKVEKIPPKSVKGLKKSERIAPTLRDQTAKDIKFRSKRSCRVNTRKNAPTPTKSSENLSELSPFKTPSKDLDSSLVTNRPKRICKLPSKFEDHFISPNKLVPVQPCHASTPISQKNTAHVTKSPKVVKTARNSGRNGAISENSVPNATQKVKSTQSDKERPIKTTKVNAKLIKSNDSVGKSSPDTNNNGKKVLPRRVAKLRTKKTSPQCNKITPFAKRLVNKSASFRILEDLSDKSKNLDVYEFTFDPNEEPTPQKKKRKKVVRKKPTKPKTFDIPKVTVPKSNYDDNIAKALTNLKTQIKPQVVQSENVKNTQTQQVSNIPVVEVPITQVTAKPLHKDLPQSHTNIDLTKPTNETAKTSLHESNYASIRVEDIAADFEMDESHNNINYSPVNTPQRPKTPEVSKANLSKDPLNLQDGSFFDAPPVASSSMNVSRARGDPLASPWRVEFGSLPIKWHANTYVKANMTPAVECSFINSEDIGKKKHVYTNMIPEEPLPQIEDAPALKQTSIISFMKEVAERSAKKKRKRSVSPTKASYFFDDAANLEFGYKTPKKAKKSTTDTIADKSNEKSDENISNSSNKLESPSKNKKKDNEMTYFGFDESENDQENLSPDKVPNTRSKRGLRSRGVLQECNRGPTRAAIPAKAKLTSSEVVKHLYDQMKSAEDAPQFPEKETAMEPTEKQRTNIEEPVQNDNDDAESVHLFEDIELIHHLKPHRKSYSKPKKVAFQRHSNSDSDTEDVPRVEANSSDEDDLADLSFHLPNVKEKKVKKKKSKKKKLLSKKEEKEIEEWAAGFNSMCEDVEEFALVLE